MRLFFAVELPPEVQQALGRLRMPDVRDYRWVDPSLIHLTLAFLGEQPEAALPALEAIAAEAARAVGPFELRLGQVGSFGPKRAPRVLWVGLEGDLDALGRLHAALAAGLRHGGYPVEDRPFAPHITLARRRESAGRDPLPGWPPSSPPARTFRVAALSLMHSRLGHGGPRYAALAHAALR
jgi:RNA 2',3'-cyclic 3'-phosphodiesterase